MFINSIRQLQSGWEGYRVGGKTNKNNPIHNLVLYEFKEIIEEWLLNKDQYLVKGSDGQGNILRTPWIAIMDREITTSATQGYYIVYLFDENLEKMYLEIGFGAYQFEQKFGRGKKYFDALDSAVKDMQDSSDHLLSKLEQNVRARIRKQRPSLDTQGDFHLRSYERCSIYSLEYELSSISNDAELKKDLIELTRLYGFMTGSLLLADVDDYVLETIESPSVSAPITASEFEPRIIKRRQSGTSGEFGKERRYSKKSDKVGKFGEEFVFNYERGLLINSGFPNLAAKVIWHRNEKSNRTPGWDITSYDESGNEKYIEVKATIAETISSVIITSNEAEKMQKLRVNNNYFIYQVTNIVKNPKVEIIRNPAQFLEEGKIEMSVESYSLLLGKRIE
jgi:hypothetical protein